VFSSLPLPSALANLPGVSTTVNQYAWTTGRFGPPRVIDSADLVGSSLVETGVVDAEPYLRKVAELVRDHGVQRYFAHRRESADKLEVLRERTGVRVVRPSLPLELYARSGPVGRTVLSFPSTLVHTLPLVLAGTGVRVLVGEVEADWLSRAHASGGRAAGFLAEVTATARRRHGLDLLPRTAAAA
jgi:hypothetical protein